MKTLSGAREAGFALSEWNSLLVGWLKRLNGLNGLMLYLSFLRVSFLVFYYASFNFAGLLSFRDRYICTG